MYVHLRFFSSLSLAFSLSFLISLSQSMCVSISLHPSPFFSFSLSLYVSLPLPLLFFSVTVFRYLTLSLSLSLSLCRPLSLSVFPPYILFPINLSPCCINWEQHLGVQTVGVCWSSVGQSHCQDLEPGDLRGSRGRDRWRGMSAFV